MNLSSVFPDANPKMLRRIALLALAMLLIAHSFCFFNLTYSGESVMLNVEKGKSAQIASGAFLMPVYWHVRGAISSPLWVGLLSAVYLALTAALIGALLGVASPYLAAMLAGAVTLSPSVLSIFAGSIHIADAVFLSVLLAACAVVLCLRVRAGALLGALVLAAAQALDRSALAFYLGLTLLCIVKGLLHPQESTRIILRRSVRALLCAAICMVVYAGGFLLFLHRFGLDREAMLQAPVGKSLVGAWLYPIQLLFKPLTIYAHVGIVLHALLIVLGGVALLKCLPQCKGRIPALVLLIAAFPLVINLPAYSTLPAAQTSMPYILLDALLIVLLQAAFESSVDERHIAYRTGALLLGISLLGTSIFANQVYLKKALEFDSTLSAMTRVIARAEAVPEFKPGDTPVALVGSLETSDLSVVHEGLEKLNVLDAAKNNYATVNDEDNIWYTWEIMGYPFNFVDAFTLSRIAAREDVQAMPAFPDQDCCQLIDGTLVIKLSDM